MSFLIDPPLLFISGAAIFFAARKSPLIEGKGFAIGNFIVLMFISVSVLLYLDAVNCFFPFVCGDLSGSEFMFNSDITGIYKKDAHPVFVIIFFALYPLWFYSGYAIARKFLFK